MRISQAMIARGLLWGLFSMPMAGLLAGCGEKVEEGTLAPVDPVVEQEAELSDQYMMDQESGMQ